MQGEGSGESVPPVKTAVKGGKKPFGHHSGKPGLPFCTMDGMGQVSTRSSGSLASGLPPLLVSCGALLCSC